MSNQSMSRKLTLHRETLRTLRSDELDGVNGGKDTAPISGAIGAAIGALYNNDTVFRPGNDKPVYNDTVYRGGAQIIPV